MVGKIQANRSGPYPSRSADWNCDRKCRHKRLAHAPGSLMGALELL